MKKEILLVDGMALLFRGYYATAFRGNFMKTSKGIPTNGVYQFLRYFLDAIQTFEPSHVICCWDMGSQTFRTHLYQEYKANREAPPEELIPQFDLVKDVVDSFDTPNIGLENYEADDCIGTLARHFGAEHQVLILTGDQDLLQLIEPSVSVAIMRKGIGHYEIFNEENFYEKKGIQPKQMIDFKGLTGDSADNYPGVKGIGEKTALKLLKEYHTIDDILDHIDQLPKGMKTKIKRDLDMLHLSRNLAEIKCDIPVSCSLDHAIWQFDKGRVYEKLSSLEFKRLDDLLA